MHSVFLVVDVPLHNGDLGLAFNGQVLLSASSTQQVVRVPAATLASKPAVDIGAVTAIALTVSAASTTRVALLHVLIEVCHIGLAQLTHDHLVTVVGLTNVLQGVGQSITQETLTYRHSHRGLTRHDTKHS